MADQILPPNIDRQDTYDRKNFADQPAKFLRQDGSVTESIPASITGGIVDVITNPVEITNANLDAPLSDIKANQTSGNQKTQVVNSGGVNIDFATSAKQDVIIAHIDGIESGLTAIETNQTDGTQKTMVIDYQGEDITKYNPFIVDTGSAVYAADIDLVGLNR